MVLQRRLVNLRRKGYLILGIGLYRIKVFGAFGERRIKDVLTAFNRRIGVVLLAITGSKQQKNS